MKKIFVLILLIIPLLLNARTFTGIVMTRAASRSPECRLCLKAQQDA